MKNRAKREALLVAAGILTVTLLCNIAVTFIARQGLLSEVQSHLLSLAKTAAAITDGDSHAAIKTPDQQESDDYKRIQGTFLTMMKANHELYFLYSYVLVGDTVHFIVDTPPINAVDAKKDKRNDNAQIMEVYPEPTAALMEALTQQKPTVEDKAYSDEWGTFLSAYAPLYNSKHEFLGVVGADMDASDFIGRIARIWWAFGVGVLVSSLIAYAVYRAVLRMRTQQHRLNTLRKARAVRTSQFLEEIRHLVTALAATSDRVRSSADGIARMASQSSERTGDAQRDIRGASGRISSITVVCDQLLETAQMLQAKSYEGLGKTQHVRSQLVDSNTQAQKLVEVANNISKIVLMIADITARIDLLALNATIEAARAGVAGKGFAVVAEEVKILSQQTAEATQSIGRYALEIQEATGGMLQLVSGVSAAIEELDISGQQTASAADSQKELIHVITADIVSVNQSAVTLEARVEAVSAIAHETEIQTFSLFEVSKDMARENFAFSSHVNTFLSDLEAMGGLEPVSAPTARDD